MKKRLILFVSFVALMFQGCTQQKNGESKNDLEGAKCELTVATFNLRMDTESDGDDAWPHRKEMVKGLVRFHDFDIFGTQEAFKHMLDGVVELDGYAYFGKGRDDGKDGGEHSAIVYKKDRLELLDGKTFWLSETPDVPGKGWDAICCNRICTWGKFKDKVSGKEFFMFNVHYDHQGKVARRESSKLLLSKIEEIAGKESNIFVTGDFNATPDDEPMQIISNSGFLRDSYRVSKIAPYGTKGTFNSFKIDAPADKRIDYIWVTKPESVMKYGVLNDMQYSHFPSDHFPVMIKVEF